MTMFMLVALLTTTLTYHRKRLIDLALIASHLPGGLGGPSMVLVAILDVVFDIVLFGCKVSGMVARLRGKGEAFMLG